MIAIDIGKETFSLPENWEEVIRTGKYMEVVRINYTETDVAEAKKQMLFALAGMTPERVAKAMNLATATDRKKKAAELDLYMAVQIVEEVFPALDFIFEPQLFTINPIPFIEHQGRGYYGHTDNLTKQTGAEMEDAGWAYAEYVKSGDEMFLNHLVASLYRQSGEKYSKEGVEKQAKAFATLDPLVKRGVLLWYEMCEQWWKRQYEFLYTGTGEPQDIDSLSNSRLIRALAGDKRGTVNAVREMSRDEIFFELSELERQREALQK